MRCVTSRNGTIARRALGAPSRPQKSSRGQNCPDRCFKQAPFGLAGLPGAFLAFLGLLAFLAFLAFLGIPGLPGLPGSF